MKGSENPLEIVDPKKPTPDDLTRDKIAEVIRELDDYTSPKK